MQYGGKIRLHNTLCRLIFKEEPAHSILCTADMVNEYKSHIQLQQKADTHLKAGRLIPAVVYRISQENIILYMETAPFMPFGKVQAVQRSTILILIYRVDLEHSTLCMEYTGKDYLFLHPLQPKMDIHFRDGLHLQRVALSINPEIIIQFIVTPFCTQFGVNLHSIVQLLSMQMVDLERRQNSKKL